MNLNFACGPTVWDGFDNSDIHGHPGTSVVDLERHPYPYEDGSADLVMMSHALWMTHDGVRPVHPDPRPILGEFHRILRPGGWLRIDDNPWRCFPEHDPPPDMNEAAAAFPREQRTPRHEFMRMFWRTGFRLVAEVATGHTMIPVEGSLRECLVGNGAAHTSFTVEARK